MAVAVVKAGAAGGLQATGDTPGCMHDAWHPESIQGMGYRGAGVAVGCRSSTHLNNYASVESNWYVFDWNNQSPGFQDYQAWMM